MTLRKELIKMDRRKELKQAYKENPRPMGVFQIRNQANGKILVASSMNLPGTFNSHRFQLNMNVHRNHDLQEDWNKQGADTFAFEILEELKTEELPQETWRDEVLELEKKWLEQLRPYGEVGYNKEKKQQQYQYI